MKDGAKGCLAKVTGVTVNLGKDKILEVPEDMQRLTGLVVQLHKEAGSHLADYVTYAFLLGCYINEYSKREDIRKITAEKNAARGRGHPLIARNLVAEMVHEEAAGLLPGSTWLKKCAKTVADAEEAGFELKKFTSIWSLKKALTGRGLQCCGISGLLPAPAEAADRSSGDKDFDELLDAATGVIRRRLQKLAVQYRGKRAQQRIQPLVEALNAELAWFDLAVYPVQAKDRPLG